MSWSLLLALCVLLLLVVKLLCFLCADGDLTLMWSEWLGRRPEQELTGLVVWVTGASSGIGEELAYQLSKLGVSLVLSARRVHELERVKRKCLDNGNLKEKDIFILPFDLANISSHEVATKAVLQEFGRGFIHSLQIELTKHPGIIVSNICPGPVHSNIRNNLLTEEVTKTVNYNKTQDREMATSRCVRLMLVAMANNLKEVWIGEQPYLSVPYLWQYMPTLAWWIICKFWEKRIELFKSDVVQWHTLVIPANWEADTGGS
ncbi:dehydrogenase/reductase SDR family member 7 isoform X3 [Ictidomys tridecemlineatus]